MSDDKPTTGAGLTSRNDDAETCMKCCPEHQEHWAVLLAGERAMHAAALAARDAEIARLRWRVEQWEEEARRNAESCDYWRNRCAATNPLAELGRLAVEWVRSVNLNMDTADVLRYAVECADEDWIAAQPEQGGEQHGP